MSEILRVNLGSTLKHCLLILSLPSRNAKNKIDVPILNKSSHAAKTAALAKEKLVLIPS